MCKSLTVVFALFISHVYASTQDIEWHADKLVKEKMCTMCHSKDKVGDQVGKWKEGPHAKAFESLKTDKAKEVAAKMGIDDPTTAGQCLKCHSTAYGFTETVQTKMVDVEDGVTCQTCHGPGKDYIRVHSKDAEKAHKELGLIKPNAQNTCLKCHNENNPTHTEDFDFDKAWEKIQHNLKK